MSLSAADLAYVREVVRERSAIVLDDTKAYLVESRLAPIVRRTGSGDLGELIARMRGDHSGQLRDVVVEAMTTNETSFFRDPGVWRALERSLLPALIERRGSQQALTVWCGAASSGQEPYSVAMLLVERFPEVVRDWNVRIIATDLSADMLGRAAAGRFTQYEVNRGVSAERLARHFVREGSDWRVCDPLRQMVEFRALNLAEPWPFVPQVDVLLLRNVLIYFDLTTKREILQRCRTVLRRDGHLILGTSETTLNIDDRFERVVTDGATTYRPC